MGGRLRVRIVRRYRGAAYPSRRVGRRHRRAPGRELLRAAAGPALALGLGGAACAPASGDPDGWGVIDTVAPDRYYVRYYFTEAEAKGILREVIEEETGAPVDPCASPTLSERLVEDAEFSVEAGSDHGAVVVNADLLAEAVVVEATLECPAVERPAVGIEFVTTEGLDREDYGGGVEGVSFEEAASLAVLRAAGTAAIVTFDESTYPYGDGGYAPDAAPSRAEAEALLREDVRLLLEDLRREGFL